MSFSFERALVRVPLVAVVLATSAPAWAQATARPLSETLHGEARDDYSSAKILFANSDFAGALTKYRQAYEHSKDARLLYDMAICEKNLHRYARMEADLRQYEKEEGASLTPDDKQTVDEVLAAVKNMVGAVNLTAGEPDAAVQVDGDFAGTTPLALPLVLDLGAHTIRVTKEGFAPAEKTVEIEGGSALALPVTLTPLRHAAHLVITTDAEATVSIDGQVVGKGHFDGHPAPGSHDVAITETGMRSHDAEIDLRDGETRTLEITLDRERHTLLWPWIAGGAAVVAGAAVGGYFLFKPSDSVTPIPAGKYASVTFSSWRP